MGGGVKKLPFENKTANTFGWQSFDPSNQFVRDYMNADIGVDPGAKQRTDLAEEASQNQWNSAFMAGVPQQVRMMNMEASQRGIRREGAQAQQQAQYQQRMLDLARKERMLPQLVQTGGTSTGFQSQASQGGGLGNLLGGAGGAMAGVAMLA